VSDTRKWIAVTEALPEYTRHAGPYSFVIVLAAYAAGVGEAMFCNDQWFILCGIETSSVTHWMPLPEHPDKEV
jgi:hypothetical protein